jgi:predicted thioesterase
MRFPGIIIGDSLTVEEVVSEGDTTDNYGVSHVENLLSTPALIAKAIDASVRLVDDKLPPGFITVGKSVELVHEHPTVLGAAITVKAEIKSFDGYHIKLSIVAYDKSGIIGRGSHVRSIVNEKWMKLKVQKRIAGI